MIRSFLIKVSLLTLFLNNVSAELFIQGAFGFSETIIKIEDKTQIAFNKYQTINEKYKFHGEFTRFAFGYQAQTSSDFKGSIIFAFANQGNSKAIEEVLYNVDYITQAEDIFILDLYFRLGYKPSKYFMLYGNLGFSVIDADVTREGIGGIFSGSYNKTKNAVLFGLGMEAKIIWGIYLFVEANGRFISSSNHVNITGKEVYIRNNKTAEAGIRIYF